MTSLTQSDAINGLSDQASVALGSKIILIFLALLSLVFSAWAGMAAFEDTSSPVSALAMMGMMGYIFHSAVILLMLSFAVQVRRSLTLLLLIWHIPEAILIAGFGMGVPEGRMIGVLFHSAFSLLALLSWYLERDKG